MVTQETGLRPITKILSAEWQDAYTALETREVAVTTA